MKFLNKRTGVVIDVPCRLDGPDWKEVTEAKKEAPEDHNNLNRGRESILCYK